MKPLTALKNLTLSFSSIGQTFEQPPFWAVSNLLGTPLGDREAIANDFDSYVERAYKGNGIVFACILARLAVFSQARLRYQEFDDGRPGRMHGDPSLTLLERPWPNGTTVELLSRMEQDASLAGNFFATLTDDGTRIRRLRPDWVDIVTVAPDRDDGSRGSAWDIGARVAGYVYRPGGRMDGATLLAPEQVVHWSPIPDPQAQWRGMSWLTSVLREVQSDTSATRHKAKFFENDATGNMVIKYDPNTTKEQIEEYAALFAAAHRGVDNAYKTFHLGGGADPQMIGANLQQLDFKATQGAGETRIAAASGVGAIIAQFSEGMQGSSLNAGNYGAARRRFSDITMQNLWGSAATALEKFATVPGGSRLWFDARDIPFLQEDAKDEAEIRKTDAVTVRQLTEAGYTPDSIKEFVKTGDAGVLEHTGVFSVQLQPPGSGSDPAARISVDVRNAVPLLLDGWTFVERDAD